MKHYLLDTNIVSHIIKGDLPQVHTRLEATPMQSLCVSVVTQGELLYGVAKGKVAAKSKTAARAGGCECLI